VLKTIVKDEAVWVEMLNSILAGSGTICVADNSNSFKIFCQKISFVTGLTRRGKDSLPV
jgi:hypothetical protein